MEPAPSDTDYPLPEVPATLAQASLLKALRPLLRPAIENINKVSSELACHCEHPKPDDYLPETCHICNLYGRLTDIVAGLGGFEIAMDMVLTRAEVK